MLSTPRLLLGAALLTLAATPGGAQQRSARPAPVALAVPAPPYADVADLVLAAPAIVDVTIRGTSRIKLAEAPGLAPGHARFYVEADVLALIRSTEPLPPRVGYLLDVPLDSRGRAPALRKARVLLFARAVPRTPGQVQLVRPDAQRPWTPALDALTRRITSEALAANAPPHITGVSNAFHTPGALPGEGETQVFLTTREGRPVSITIVRRPGAERRWSIALSEVVDENVGPPVPDTLLWYRLACGLPAALPGTGLTSAESPDDATARDDYRFVISALGRCTRTPR